MIRIGISWGFIQIGRNRCFHIGLDHHRRALGDGMRRVGIQFGIVHDDAMDIRGIHLSPYYMGAGRARVQAYVAAVIAAILFAVSVYALVATDVPHPQSPITNNGN